LKEGLESTKRRIKSGDAEPRASANIVLCLETFRLLDMKLFKITKFGVGFEPAERLGDAIDRRFVAAFRLFQPDEIFTLDALVGLVVFSLFHVLRWSHN
jgi:hypothetical protein